MGDSPKPRDIRHCREAALAAVDKVLQERPQSVQPACLEMTHALVELRDALILEARGGASAAVARELAHTNSVLSLVVGIQYPLEGVKSEKLGAARAELAKLSTETRES